MASLLLESFFFLLHVSGLGLMQKQAAPISGYFDLFMREKFICEVNLTLCFNYGTFGFGYSSQVCLRI